MKTLILVVSLSSLLWAGGCWNPNTHRWEWCPENPYQSSEGLYGSGADIGRSNVDAANAIARQRSEEERLTIEAGRAAAERLRARRRQQLEENL